MSCPVYSCTTWPFAREDNYFTDVYFTDVSIHVMRTLKNHVFAILGIYDCLQCQMKTKALTGNSE